MRVIAVVLLATFVTIVFSSPKWHFAFAESAYKLPVSPGTKVQVTQGNNNSKGDHIGKEKYAFDFANGQSFTVVAARGGTVIGMRQDSEAQCYPDDSCWADANYVLIDHGDGTSGLYLHLAKGSVPPGVQVGGTVKQGDSLGTAGSTGFSSGIHLHFEVEETPSSQTQTGWWILGQSVPVSFGDKSVLSQNHDGVPTYGNSYMSDNMEQPNSTAPQAPIAGSWSSPSNGATVSESLTFSALFGQPPEKALVVRVDFKYFDNAKRTWLNACSSTTPEGVFGGGSGGTTFSCDWSLSGIPAGTLGLCFDVHYRAGTTASCADAQRLVTVSVVESGSNGSNHVTVPPPDFSNSQPPPSAQFKTPVTQPTPRPDPNTAPSPIATLPPTPVDATASVWTDKNSYEVGSSGTLCFNISQPGQVVITDTDPQGNVTTSLNQYESNGACFTATFSPPVGTDTLRISLYGSGVVIANGQAIYQIRSPQVSYVMTITLDASQYNPGAVVTYCYHLSPENVPYQAQLFNGSTSVGQWDDNGNNGGDCRQIPISSTAAPGSRTLTVQSYINGAMVAQASATFTIASQNSGGGGGSPPPSGGSCDRAPSTPTNFSLLPGTTTLTWQVTDPGGSGCVLRYQVNDFGGPNVYEGSSPSANLPTVTCNSGYFIGAANQNFDFKYYAFWGCPSQ